MFVPRRYCIRMKGRLGPEWSEWFDGLAISSAEDAETVLVGRIVDQAALHGVLSRLVDLGLVLVSLSSLPDEGEVRGSEADTKHTGSLARRG